MTYPKHSMKNFTWSRDETGLGGVFVIERSTLDFNGGIGPDPRLPSILGFVMTSEKTGKEVLFTLADQKFDGRGEITFWTFKPPLSMYSQPGMGETQYMEVRVYNT